MSVLQSVSHLGLVAPGRGIFCSGWNFQDFVSSQSASPKSMSLTLFRYA